MGQQMERRKSLCSGEEEEEGEMIAFFDVETTVPARTGQGFAMLEFGAILVCPRKLVEVDSYSTLIRPRDLFSVSPASVRCNGITREAVATAPTFQEVANQVYQILHGRVWAGHNIVRFDCARIREAFAEIGRPAPEPKGMIDSLALLTQRFGRRAGDMKMATLATYFGLGQQKHRSLDDVRMNLEVLKYCATVLFLESSLPDILTTGSWVSPNATTRSRSNGKTYPEGTSRNQNSSSDFRFRNHQGSSSINAEGGGEVHAVVESSENLPSTNAFDLTPLLDQMKIDPSQPDGIMDLRPEADSTQMFSRRSHTFEGCSGYGEFLDPDEVSIPAISISHVPTYRGGSRILLLHKDVLLQLCCMDMGIRFGVSAKFVDHTGRPRLSIVVSASRSLCEVLDMCDHLAQKASLNSGSSSEWRPVVIRKNGFSNSSAIRLNIPTVANGDGGVYSTDICQTDVSGSIQKLVFSSIDPGELNSLFTRGTCIDAYFSLDVYDYHQKAGVRLVAKRLIVHSK